MNQGLYSSLSFYHCFQDQVYPQRVQAFLSRHLILYITTGRLFSFRSNEVFIYTTSMPSLVFASSAGHKLLEIRFQRYSTNDLIKMAIVGICFHQ